MTARELEAIIGRPVEGAWLFVVFGERLFRIFRPPGVAQDGSDEATVMRCGAHRAQMLQSGNRFLKQVEAQSGLTGIP